MLSRERFFNFELSISIVLPGNVCRAAFKNNKTMTEQLVTQHYVPEWHTDEGVRIVVARIYVGSKRTSAYVPMPPEHWPDGVPGEVYRKVQEMYDIDNQKQF